MMLIRLGARLQLLEQETSLSRERLINIYKELQGVSSPKGLLPFSTDWYITWQPNIHASLFLSGYNFLVQHAHIHGVMALIKAYQLYLEQINIADGCVPILSVTRAWTLLRFISNDMLKTTPCKTCGGHFIVHPLDLNTSFLCGLCKVPSRAGKSGKSKKSIDSIKNNAQSVINSK